MKPFIFQVQNDVPTAHNKNSKKSRIDEFAADLGIRFGMWEGETHCCEGDVCKIDD